MTAKCIVCGGEYCAKGVKDVKNFMCKFCMADKGLLKGAELEEVLKAKREVENMRYWVNRNDELRKIKCSEFKKLHIKKYHYKLGYEECQRRANLCQKLDWDIAYDMEYDDMFITRADGTKEKAKNYTAETWRKKRLLGFAHDYWNLIAFILRREYQIKHPRTMHFEHKDIIITDPCYIVNDDHDWVSKAESIKSGMCTDTLYGDWSCTVFDLDTKEEIGQFCADAGMVCVYPLDEPLLDKKEVKKFLKKDWCATVIKDFTGDISFVRHAGKENEWRSYDDYLTVEGRGSVNFSGRQTGL